MTLEAWVGVLFMAVASHVSCARLHLATEGLLQIAPSFTGDAILLYPGHHPDHDTDDLGHLTPQTSHKLYYSQEGHRPALHGAKHGSLKATFVRPTVVLDHSSHFRDVRCSPGNIEVCFKTYQAFQTAQKSWPANGDFSLVTYHVGCGDETSGKRSFFHAKDVVFDSQTNCGAVNVSLIAEDEALESGEITWGTYQHPDYKKRVPVRGHVRLDQSSFMDQSEDMNVGGAFEDLEHSAAAQELFFDESDVDETHINDPVPGDQDLPVISDDGEIPGGDDSPSPYLSASPGPSATSPGSGEESSPPSSARRYSPQRTSMSHKISRRFLDGLFRAIKNFIDTVTQYFQTAVQAVTKIAKVLIDIAITGAKVVAAAFGVPFNHSYHHDFKFDYFLKGIKTNKPLDILGLGEGFNLAGSGQEYTVECIKCGIHGDFTVSGKLAFSIREGVTEGYLSLVNHDAFTIDAQFGFKVTLQHDKAVKGPYNQLGAVPLSPLAIPGIIVLGPQASIGVVLDLVLTGNAELAIGGSFSVAPGVATISIAKDQNKLEGLETTFTPIFRANGSITATIEVGLPIAIEMGIDVLNGKFKKTVGLVNKPSVYATATYSKNENHTCDNGVEMRVGIKNRIYVAALDVYDYDIRTDVLYEKGITCLTASGFDSDKVEPDKSVFINVSENENGDKLEDGKPVLNNVASNLTAPVTDAGFRIIMDEEKTSILVSGTDGYIYLAPTSQSYDSSAPWGTLENPSDLVNLDVFGRIMGMASFGFNDALGEVNIQKVTRVPKEDRAVGLKRLKTDGDDFHFYALTTSAKHGDVLFYPTFCKTANGLRLFASFSPVGNSGIRGKDRQAMGGGRGEGPTVGDLFKSSAKKFGIIDPEKSCRTIKLTSQLARDE